MPALLNSQSTTGTDHRARFASLANQLAALAAKEDLKIVPYFDSTLPHFAALTESGQIHAVWMLEILTSISERLQRRGVLISKSRALVWAFFSQMKLRPPSDMQEKVSDDQEAINVFNEAHQLIFANLTFFRITGYSLEDLYCRPWTEIFTHQQPELMDLYFGLCRQILNGEKQETIDISLLPPYTCVESQSPLRRTTLCNGKAMAPLWDQDNRVAGYMSINKVRILDSAKGRPLQ